MGPNLNLGILATIKDGLAAKQTPSAPAKTRTGSYEILGLPWYFFLLYTFTGLGLLYFIIEIFIRAYRKFERIHQAHLQSEAYWFRQFRHSTPYFPDILRNLYRWWNRFNLPGKQPSMLRDASTHGAESVANQLSTLYQEAYEENQPSTTDPSFKKNIQQYRERILDETREVESISIQQQPW